MPKPKLFLVVFEGLLMETKLPSLFVITTCVISYSDCRFTTHQGDASTAVRAHDADRKSEFWFPSVLPGAAPSMKELCQVGLW